MYGHWRCIVSIKIFIHEKLKGYAIIKLELLLTELFNREEVIAKSSSSNHKEIMSKLPKDKKEQEYLPFERIQTIFYKWQRTLVVMVGHDIYTENFEFKTLFYIVYSMILAFLISAVNTMITREIFMKLEAFAYLCVFLEVSM